MLRWAERQRDFALALLDPVLPLPADLVGPDGEPSLRRFSVYRNNVVAGLTETLKEAFPATCRIVELEFFRAMARVYAVSDPPRSPILLDYGAGFPDFIAGFGPAFTLPYLPAVARIERAWIKAYHSPEGPTLDAAALSEIDAEHLPDLRLSLHSSVSIVRSELPAVTIWGMNVEGGVAAPVDLAGGGEDALVLRPDADVEVRSMPPGGAAFVTALAEEKSVIEATRAATDEDARFDLSLNLAGLLEAGAFARFRISGSDAAGRPEGRS